MKAETDARPEGLTCVLPVTLSEYLAETDPISSWRHCPNYHTPLRLATLLRSFLRYFDSEDLAEFLIIAPDIEIAAIDSIIRPIVHDDPRYVILGETSLGLELDSATKQISNGPPGWVIQQLLKLLAANRVRSSYYLTLDSDILCIKPVTCDRLFIDQRPITNVERPEDYLRLYTSSIALREYRVKQDRYLCSARCLGFDGDPNRSYFFGETPVILRTQVVRKLLSYLDERLFPSFQSKLLSSFGWTEYGLYFQFVEKKEGIENVCALASCGDMLNLEASVWLPNKCYRNERTYNAEHFNAAQNHSWTGPFIAIQSWLPITSWLPHEYPSVTTFYSDLMEWLDL